MRNFKTEVFKQAVQLSRMLTTMACQVCLYKNLQINPLYGQVMQQSGQIIS